MKSSCTPPASLLPQHALRWTAVGLLLWITACNKPAPSSTPVAVEKSVRIEDVRPKAEQGDVQAQTALGKLLIEGSGARQDYTQAVHWFQQAADKGSADAQFYLASLYEAGRGVKGDLAEAVRWNRKAAEAGHCEAQYAVALLYAMGRGTPKDKPESVKWFRAAAEQGLAEAQFNLAQRYQHGQGIATNLADAYKWFAVAAKQGLPDAAKECSQLKSGLSAQQITEGDRFAASFSPRKSASAPPP